MGQNSHSLMLRGWCPTAWRRPAACSSLSHAAMPTCAWPLPIDCISNMCPCMSAPRHHGSEPIQVRWGMSDVACAITAAQTGTIGVGAAYSWTPSAIACMQPEKPGVAREALDANRYARGKQQIVGDPSSKETTICFKNVDSEGGSATCVCRLLLARVVGSVGGALVLDVRHLRQQLIRHVSAWRNFPLEALPSSSFGSACRLPVSRDS